MKKLFKPAFLILVFLMMAPESHAQRGRGGFGGGEGGGGRGSRGGGEGGGFGGGGRGGGEAGGGRGGRGGEAGGMQSRAGGMMSRGGGGPTRGGSSGFDMGSAMAGRFDANKDGKLDPSEMQRIPESFRSRLKADGVNLDRTVSTSELGKAVSASFEKMREQRMSGSEDRGRGGDDRGRGRDDRQKGGTNGQPVPPSLFKMPERLKVIKTLSTELADADIDQDGMVALYEWSEAGMSFEEFYSKDRNDDGFVTALEEQGDVAVDIARFKTDRLTIVTATSTVNNAAAKLSFSDSPKGMSVTQFSKPEDSQKGRDMFKGLDKDGNGRLTADEWEKSGRIKSWFESSKIKLTDMNSEQFAKTYSGLVSKYRKDRESKDKKSDRRR